MNAHVDLNRCIFYCLLRYIFVWRCAKYCGTQKWCVDRKLMGIAREKKKAHRTFRRINLSVRMLSPLERPRAEVSSWPTA